MKVLYTSWYCPNCPEDDDDDAPTDPGTECPHDVIYHATHGWKTGNWCRDCGKLVKEP